MEVRVPALPPPAARSYASAFPPWAFGISTYGQRGGMAAPVLLRHCPGCFEVQTRTSLKPVCVHFVNSKAGKDQASTLLFILARYNNHNGGNYSNSLLLFMVGQAPGQELDHFRLYNHCIPRCWYHLHFIERLSKLSKITQLTRSE